MSIERNDQEEREANYFAMCLLMPEEWLRRDVNVKTFDLNDDKKIKSLASKYQVSVQLMTLRLGQIFLP